MGRRKRVLERFLVSNYYYFCFSMGYYFLVVIMNKRFYRQIVYFTFIVTVILAVWYGIDIKIGNLTLYCLPLRQVSPCQREDMKYKIGTVSKPVVGSEAVKLSEAIKSGGYVMTEQGRETMNRIIKQRNERTGAKIPFIESSERSE